MTQTKNSVQPGGEREIPYDLTYNQQNTSKQTIPETLKFKNNLKVTRGEVGGVNGRKRGKGFQEHL